MEVTSRPQKVPVYIEEEMRESFMAYAMSVIISRALPDVRDGLKPVHRRVLYAMYDASNTSDKAYKKSARLVGDIMGKYHPHGDSAIYDTIVRMAQDFNLRYPLVDGQGNFGSIDGDNPAAMRLHGNPHDAAGGGNARRYRKRNRRFHRELRRFIARAGGFAVAYSQSFDQRLGGIAVGMATNIPPHNLSEVIAALCR
jgi:DNA gyrase subunit A